MTEETENFYSRKAERMDEQFSEERLTQEFLDIRDRFLKHVEDGRILDAGCGTGRDVKYFIEEGFDAVGVDSAPGMIKKARKRKGKFIEKDLRELEFESNSFDGIWCCATIFFMPREEMKEVLNQFHKILKPSGTLYISFEKGQGRKDKVIWGEKLTFHTMPKKEAANLLEQAGFEIKHFETHNNAPAPFINFICKTRE